MSQAAMAVHLDKTGALYLSCPQESMATAITIQDVWTRHREDLRRVEEQMTGFLSTRVPLIGQVGDISFRAEENVFALCSSFFRPGSAGTTARPPSSWGPSSSSSTRPLFSMTTSSTRRRFEGDGPWPIPSGKPRLDPRRRLSLFKALLLAVGLKNQRVMDTLAEATTTMSEGEVMELLRVADLGLSEEDYFKIVDAKTAALISASCRLGAILGARAASRKRHWPRSAGKSASRSSSPTTSSTTWPIRKNSGKRSERTSWRERSPFR